MNSSFSELYHANSSASGDDASAYDNLNRITNFQRGTLSASGNNGSTLDTVSTLNSLANSSQSWNLDSLGNANSVTTDGTQQNRTFNSQNEATTVGSNTLGYDSNGNMTTDGQGRTLFYDAWNRLVAVENSSAILASYSYDANGNRISQTENSTTTDLYYSSAGQVIEERQAGTVTDQYVWGLMYVNDLILRDDNSSSGNLGIGGSGLGRRLYIQQDVNWNVTAIDGATGVAERFVYTPYGVPTVLSSSWTATTDAYGLAYGFQGMRYDPATGMLHADARDYSPTLERWTEADPQQYVNGMNYYGMETGAPTDYVDPTGLDAAVAEPLPEVGPGTGTGPGDGDGVDPLNLPSGGPAINPNWAPFVMPNGQTLQVTWNDIYGTPPPGFMWDTTPYLFDPALGDPGPRLIFNASRQAAINAADAKLLTALQAIAAARAQGQGNGTRPPCKTAQSSSGPEDPCDDLIYEAFGGYDAIKKLMPNGWQAHHVLQNAAVQSKIPRGIGPAIGLPAKAHALFHRSLNKFWAPYQPLSGSPLADSSPTWYNYDNALRNAFQDAGCSSDVINAIIKWTQQYRSAMGIRPNQTVPKVPYPFNTNVIFPL